VANDQHAARADIDVTRSDEQLLLDIEWWPRQRVRVRKLIVTELRTISVEVRREELCVETIDIDRSVVTTHPMDPGPLELVLHDEEIVVQRRAVP
jgi:stress response protein YsnF